MEEKHALLDPVSRSRLHEDIVGQIQGKILRREILPGDRIPGERELASELGVNRATVREALKKLEMLGLVEIRHGNGIYVKDFLESGNLEILRAMFYQDQQFNFDILRNLLFIRKILVPEMAAAAALSRREEHLQELADIVDNDKDLPVLEQDLAVHQVIARASSNMFYIFILNFFNQIFRDYGGLYFNSDTNRERSVRFHRDIYKSIKHANAEESRNIMLDVLTYTEEMIFEEISRMEKSSGGTE